ncbi:hypothetical protein U1Q18_044656 [Sarracenia purpurea var. burkii]
MALMLWRHKFSDLCCSDGLPTVWFCTKEMIAVQTMIEKQVDPYIPALGKELKNWMDYHWEKIFFDKDLGWAVLRCFNHIVCYQSGAINYVATARKLIRCEQLNDVEKYRLACVYCFEDEVGRLFPKVFCGRSKGLHNSMIKPMVHYWNNIQNKEQHCKHVCFKRIIVFYSKCARNWTGFMHFLKHFPVNEQTTHLMELVEADPMAILYVLPQVTVDQQRQVLTKHGVMVWNYLAKKPFYSIYAIRLWCFLGLFAWVSKLYYFNKTTVDDKEIGLRVKTPANQHVAGLLYDMWTMSQYNLKHYVVHKYAKNILKVLYEDDNDMLRITCRDARFLVTVFAASGDEVQTKLWHDHWCKIIFNVPPKYLNDLIGMCVKDAAEITRIKTCLSQDIEYLRKYCRFSFKEGYFEDVDDFLNFCHVDQGQIIDLKKELLSSIRSNACSILQFNDMQKWCQFDQFIDECYDPDAATKFRKEVVSSPAMHDAYDKMLLKGELFDMRRFIDVFLSPEQSVRLKQDMIDYCKINLIAGIGYNLNEANWKEFVSWCFNNDKTKIEEFKASLPIDQIFDSMLSKCADIARKDGFFLHLKKNHVCNFANLNNILKWYIGDWSEIAKFKFKKFDAFESTDQIKEKLKIDNAVLACLLNWCYDGDREKIQRRKYSASSLSPPGTKVDAKKRMFFKS